MDLNETNINDFLSKRVSNLTAKTAFERQHGGIDRMVLSGAEVAKNRLYINYTVYPTYPSKPTFDYGAMSGIKGSSRTYATSISFVPFDILPDAWKNMKENEKSQIIGDLINTADIQVHCTCPAFQMQGHHEKDSQTGDAMYAFNGPRGTGEWEQRHQKKTGACKHIYIVLNSLIDRDINLVLKKLKFS